VREAGMTRWTVFAASLLLLAAGWSPLPGQERNPALRQLRQADRVLSPDLEIREFSGEFERWSKAITVTAPGVEVFRWSSRVAGAASARWLVLDGPPGPDAEVVGSGSAGPAPEVGSVRAFRIDFRQLFPSGPPAGSREYWVVLESVDSAGQAGPRSLPVQITYAAELDVAALARLAPDIVQPQQQQMSQSNASKLLFLQNLARELVDLPARDAEDLEAAVATEDVPDAQVRLTPREPVSSAVSADAVPSGVPHVLEFQEVGRVTPWTAQHTDGRALLGVGEAVLAWLSLEPEQTYLFEVHVFVGDNATDETALSLFPYTCLIDFAPQRKLFSVSKGWNVLLATLKRPSSVSANDRCKLHISIANTGVAYNEYFYFYFYSAELTKLIPE
jgi:hypothetical protein